jgi:hypothetical protein
MNRILLLLLMLPASLAAGTQIQDTGYTSINGALFSGRITITSPNMTAADGTTLYRAVQSFTITNGLISVNLEPNDTATPAGTSYYVVYRSITGTSWSEYWVVPTSASPLTVSQVRVLTPPAPSVMIQPSQIQRGGAANGQCLGWIGSTWAPATCGAVSTVFGRSGAVVAQSGDFDTDKVTEGTINKYYLDSRARAAFGALSPLNYSPSTGELSCPSCAAGTGSAGYLTYWTGTSGLAHTPVADTTATRIKLDLGSGAFLALGSAIPEFFNIRGWIVQPSGGGMTTIRFLDSAGSPVSSIDSFGSGAWTLNGFHVSNVQSFSINSYLTAQGYRVLVDFSSTNITGSYNFGKLFDGLANGYRRFTLTGNVTATVDMSITQPGYVTTLEICQDGTGGRTITWPSTVLGFGPLDTTASKCTVQQFISRSFSQSPFARAVALSPSVSW